MKYDLTLKEQNQAMEALRGMGDQSIPSESAYYHKAAKEVAAAITARASSCEIEDIPPDLSNPIKK